MLNKIKELLRCGNTNRSQEQIPTIDYIEEFSECQAEKIFNRDLNWVIAGCIVILVLCILGVI